MCVLFRIGTTARRARKNTPVQHAFLSVRAKDSPCAGCQANSVSCDYAAKQSLLLIVTFFGLKC